MYCSSIVSHVKQNNISTGNKAGSAAILNKSTAMTSQKDVMNFFNKSKKKQSGQEELKFTEQNKHDKNEDKDGNEDGNTPI